jgi:RNA polymerase sigma-70 factor (ECF subfamily)
LNDLALARRLLAGDEPSFNAVFADYFPRLYRFALARLDGNTDTAEEIAQATLIRGIWKLDTYRQESTMFTWLCALCRRELAEWHARSGRHSNVALIEDRPEIRAALDSVAAAIDGDPERYAR